MDLMSQYYHNHNIYFQISILFSIIWYFHMYQALINYVRCDFKIDVYWQTLTAKGLTKDILASYDRPILSEPHFRPATKEGLIRDLTSYLKTLKVYNNVNVYGGLRQPQ